MTQIYQDAPATEKIRDSRPKLLQRDEAIRSAFSGTTAPTDPTPVDGQYWLDTSGGGAGVLKQRRNGAWQVADGISTSALDTSTDLGAGSASDAKVPSQLAVKTYADTKIPKSDIDTDNTLAADSDTKVPSQKAVKAALAIKAPLASPALTGTPTAPTAAAATNTTQIATTAMVQAALAAYIAAQDVQVFKGGIDCSANPNYPAADAGFTYRITVAGKIGGASGTNVEAGDAIVCVVDSSASGNQATVGANWIIVQANIDGAVVGPASGAVVDGEVVVYNSTTGKIIKSSGGVKISTETDLDDGSGAANTRLPTQLAVKTYVDGAMVNRGRGVVRLKEAGVCAVDGSNQATALSNYLAANTNIREIIVDTIGSETLGLNGGVINWRSDLIMHGQGYQGKIQHLTSGHLITIPGTTSPGRQEMGFHDLYVDQSPLSHATALAKSSFAFYLDSGTNKYIQKLFFDRVRGTQCAGFLKDAKSGVSAIDEITIDDVIFELCRGRIIDCGDVTAYIFIDRFNAVYSGWLSDSTTTALSGSEWAALPSGIRSSAGYPADATAFNALTSAQKKQYTRLALLNDTAVYVGGASGPAVGGLFTGQFEISGGYVNSVAVSGEGTVDYHALGGAPNQNGFIANGVNDIFHDGDAGVDTVGGIGFLYQDCDSVKGRVRAALVEGHGVHALRAKNFCLGITGRGRAFDSLSSTSSNMVRLEDCDNADLPFVHLWEPKGYGVVARVSSGASLITSRINIGMIGLDGGYGGSDGAQTGLRIENAKSGATLNVNVGSGRIADFTIGQGFDASSGATIEATINADLISNTTDAATAGAGTITTRTSGRNQWAPSRIQSRQPGGSTIPALGAINAYTCLFLTDVNGAYGLLGGVITASGQSWLQAQRVDGTATAYGLQLQPNGGGISIGSATPQGDGTLNVASKYYVAGVQVIGAQGAAVADLTSSATSGSLPTPNGTITIANAASPTVAELLEYCVELEAKLEALLARVRAHGLIAP